MIEFKKEIAIGHGSHDWDKQRQMFVTDDRSLCVEKYYNLNNELIALKYINFLYGVDSNKEKPYQEFLKEIYKEIYCKDLEQCKKNMIKEIGIEPCYYPELDITVIFGYAKDSFNGDFIYDFMVCGIHPGKQNDKDALFTYIQNFIDNKETREWYVDEKYREVIKNGK